MRAGLDGFRFFWGLSRSAIFNIEYTWITPLAGAGANSAVDRCAARYRARHCGRRQHRDRERCQLRRGGLQNLSPRKEVEPRLPSRRRPDLAELAGKERIVHIPAGIAAQPAVPAINQRLQYLLSHRLAGPLDLAKEDSPFRPVDAHRINLRIAAPPGADFFKMEGDGAVSRGDQQVLPGDLLPDP